jgi:pantoate--beta-alanine ligase
MHTFKQIESVRECTRKWRQSGQRIAFVPTMGNLHFGHMQLVSAARKLADKTVVSIFVNPAQFGPNEDYLSYPRTESQDRNMLLEHDVDLLFMPSPHEMYPQLSQTSVSVKNLSKLLCGANRPGHFDGVTLIICKLLNILQPDILLLGEKDRQQLTIIREMIVDLNYDVEVQSVATAREADGLAISSRNSYLTMQERRIAPQLFASLCAVRDAIISGNTNYNILIEEQMHILHDAGFRVDYLKICRSLDLLDAEQQDSDLAIIAAATLGKTRLIDNVRFQKIT